MLHITNGTATQIPIAGDVLYWADALCEGPVPGGLSMRETSRIRERFLADTFGEPTSLEARDRMFESMRDHDEVVLWFEHDLYDQLQLIQVLNFAGAGAATLSLICVDRYLGGLDAADLELLFPTRRPVMEDHLQLARNAWAAFTASDPRQIERLLNGPTDALPFLQGALLRHLQQFPSRLNGLSRTEQQILEIVTAGTTRPPAIFVADQVREERIFMGDTFFSRHLDRLCAGAAPLLEKRGGELAVTRAGHAVLNCRKDAVLLNDMDRWLGGVHLNPGEPDWRWDVAANRLHLR